MIAALVAAAAAWRPWTEEDPYGNTVGDGVILVGEVVLDVETRTWAPLGAPDELERSGMAAVWARDRLVTFGGAVIPDDGRGPWCDAELQADAWTWAP